MRMHLILLSPSIDHGDADLNGFGRRSIVPTRLLSVLWVAWSPGVEARLTGRACRGDRGGAPIGRPHLWLPAAGRPAAATPARPPAAPVSSTTGKLG